MTKKIMVVDDEPHLLKLVSKVLSKEGYKAETVSSGQKCLSKLEKGSKPDLLIIDMFMPKMSGRELLEKIRADEKLKDIKVIFLTVAQFSETGKKTLTKLDVLDYIIKPFENDDLIWRVDKVLRN